MEYKHRININPMIAYNIQSINFLIIEDFSSLLQHFFTLVNAHGHYDHVHHDYALP